MLALGGLTGLGGLLRLRVRTLVRLLPLRWRSSMLRARLTGVRGMGLRGLLLASPLLISIPLRAPASPRLTALLRLVVLLAAVSRRAVLFGLAPLALPVLTARLRLVQVGRGRLSTLIEVVSLADRVALACPDSARLFGFVGLFRFVPLIGFRGPVVPTPAFFVPSFVALRALGFHRLAAVLLTLLIRLHVLGVGVFRRRFLLFLVVGHLVFREELAGLRVTRRLAPALVLLGLRAVLVVFPLLVAAAADLVVLVRVVGAHKDTPAITCADSGNC